MAERKAEFVPPDPEQRHNYKYAILQPYFDSLPYEVVQTMLDFDLIKQMTTYNEIDRTTK